MSGTPATGPTRATVPRILSCGKSTPRLPANSRDHAPPASTTVLQRMGPRSVTTPLIRPADSSTPRTAQLVSTLAPARTAARAIAGAALNGSARPSVDV